jgi:hypothetical protein
MGDDHRAVRQALYADHTSGRCVVMVVLIRRNTRMSESKENEVVHSGSLSILSVAERTIKDLS